MGLAVLYGRIAALGVDWGVEWLIANIGMAMKAPEQFSVRLGRVVTSPAYDGQQETTTVPPHQAQPV